MILFLLTLCVMTDSFHLDNFLPYHLAVAADLISRSLAKVYADYDLTIPEWRILAHLQQHGALTPSELGSLSHMDKARVTRALILMDKKQLIRRQANERDKRVAHISLTEQGQTLFTQVEPQVLAWNERLQQALPPSDYNAVLHT